MPTIQHSLLPDADAHEPKGADNAVLGQYYVSDGNGSGVWTSPPPNTTFCLSTRFRYEAASIWYTNIIFPVDCTIINISGHTLSNGNFTITGKRNTDTSALFTMDQTSYTSDEKAMYTPPSTLTMAAGDNIVITSDIGGIGVDGTLTFYCRET